MTTPGVRLLLLGGGEVAAPPPPPPPPVVVPPTPGDVLDVAPGLGQRKAGFEFDVLDAQGHVIGQLHPMIEQAEPTIENNVARVIKRTLSNFVLQPDEYADINPFVDRVRPLMALDDGTTYSLGVFLFADDTTRERSFGEIPETMLVDQMFKLHQPILRALGYARGKLVTDIIEAQFQRANVHEYEVEDSTKTLRTPVGWAPDTSRAVIVNEACKLLGYHSAYFDRDGFGRARLVGDVETEPQVLRYEDGRNIIDGTPVRSRGLLVAPNRYVVIGAGASEEAAVGVYDIPDQAPNSIVRRNGLVVPKIEHLQGVESRDAAYEAARALARSDRNAYQWVQFSSPIDPRHDTFDVIEYRGERYLEVAWSFSLGDPGSPMRHDLRKVASEVATG